MNLKINKCVLIQIIGLTIVFFSLYHTTIAKLIFDWSNNPNFSHGLLIPFVAIYMIWYKKKILSITPQHSALSGMWIVLFGMVVHILGTVGAELFFMRLSMIITLSGIIIFYFGFSIFRQVLIPIAYLFLMIPIPAIIWNKIAFPLQLFSARIAAQMIQLIHIPVLREGNILHLANTSLEVVDACSGIRSLTSLLALTGAFAFLASLSPLKKWILFLSAIPIAVAVNIIRLTITAAMAAWISPKTAHGFLHDLSGLILFSIALILVYSVYRALNLNR